MAAKLSPDQIAELRQTFTMFDVDGGGTISTRELGYAMRSMGMNPTEAELLEMINEFDTDGSGQIEFPEFCNMMGSRMSETEDEEAVRLAFRALDKDGSGSIDTGEFIFLMTHVEEVMLLVNNVDKDGDGVLDFEEFVKIMLDDST